jgi:5-methylcytosine-specific restriction enzyme A
MKIVDHIQPKSQGGKDDEGNFQSLCQGCHNHKTARDGSRKKKGRGE